MASLKMQRGTVRAMMSKTTKELMEELRKDPREDLRCHQLFRRIEEINKKIIILNDKVMEWLFVSLEATQAEHDDEGNGVDEYEAKFLDAQVFYESIYKKEPVPVMILQEENVKKNEAVADVKKTKYRLPKLELTKFGGDPKDWLRFWNQFVSIHRDETIPPVEKYQYLLQSMSMGSRAREVVESFPPSAANYLKAVEYLKERFGKEDVLVEVYVRDMLRLVLDKKNLKISSLYDKLETQLRALESLKVTQEKYAAMLYPLVESCLPEETLRIWERQRHLNGELGEEGALGRLMKFLRGEVDGEERVLLAKGFHDNSLSGERNKTFREKTGGESTATAVDLYSGTNEKFVNCCLFCDKKHETADCFAAAKMSMEKKKKILSEKRACFICLRKNHMAKYCKANVICKCCEKNHQVVMCPEKAGGNEVKNNKYNEVTNLTSHSTGRVMLQTLVVTLKGPVEERRVRLLIDTGSQRSYVSTKAASVLKLEKCGEVKFSHSVFGGEKSGMKTHRLYEVLVESLDGVSKSKVEVLEQEIICRPIFRGSSGSWMNDLEQKGIQISDVGDGCPDIHLLIGADFAGQLFTGKMVKTRVGPVAMETVLGWTVMGGEGVFPQEESSAQLVTSLTVTDADIQSLWRLYAIGIADSPETETREVEMGKATEHFQKTVRINNEGRYEVTLPWFECHPSVANNYHASKKQLISATRKLKEKGMYHTYQTIFDTWEADGVIEKVAPGGSDLVGSYIPHHAVYKPSSLTTPVRPVFNASKKEEGKAAVNECLEKGPNLIELIPDIMTRFRMKRVGVVSDIKKAFLQISIREEDRDFLRFLWWDETGEVVQEYRHCRVVFGLTCSPFLLAATLKFHLEKYADCEDELVKLVLSSLYVDNVVGSLDSMEEVSTLMSKSVKILEGAKMELRCWVWTGKTANGGREYESVLGMLWNTMRDTLKLDLSDVCDSTTTEEEEQTCRTEVIGVGLLSSSDCRLISNRQKDVTKRQILSAAHRVFDSIGFSCPTSVVPKILLHEVFSKKLSWDEPVGEEVRKKFFKWKRELPFLAEIEIPRWLTGEDLEKLDLSFHVFSDASVSAYAGCVFLRGKKQNGSVTVQLVDAKSRVAPAKSTTIPRLELLGCLIAARLGDSVKKRTRLNLKTTFWTDSSNALHWIQKNENWAVFVWNRVAEIRRLTEGAEWRHIAGEFNPADLPSRGCGGKNLLASRWWEGPKWLYLEENEWPVSSVHVDQEVLAQERRKVVAVHAALVTSPWYGGRFSSWPKAVRITAFLLRWKGKSREEEMSVEEVTEAEKILWRSVQKSNFSNGAQHLRQLNAEKGEDGIWRVRTKLLLREDSEEFRLPILIPSKDEIVQLFLKYLHEKNSHCGVQVMLSLVREKFWLIKGRQTVRKVIARCLVCRRFDTSACKTPEASLPKERVSEAAIFEIIGVDLGRPLYLKNKEKSWFVFFTCATYRAVHLELVTSLSTEGFLQALRRFIGRRGRPTTVFSDNATNFEGARNCLDEIDWKKIAEYAVENRIEWKFSPPSAPWWGFWERLVGSTKKILRRVLGRASLTYEEMLTVLVDAEEVINSRPLTYCTEDIKDLIPLTPNLFLREIRSGSTLDLDTVDSTSLNRRLQYRQKLRGDLRGRFRMEYLGILVHRQKKSPKSILKIGTLVLIHSDLKKRVDWPLGRIEELFPGKDGVERVARVRTSTGQFLRPVRKLIALEVSEEDGRNLKETKDGNELKGKEIAEGIVTRSGRHLQPVS